MAQPGYRWRKVSPVQREEWLALRKARGSPWHSPPHRPNYGRNRFHVTAACYEHRPYIGHSPERMDGFTHELLAVLHAGSTQIFAWCVLPNHYHALVEAPDILGLLRGLGRLHGRMSFMWNGEESTRGRQVFFRVVERAMRSDRHFWATLNYVHHNPVHHLYTCDWSEWPWSSAPEFMAVTSAAEVQRIWDDYPILDYGRGWDDVEK